MKLLTTAALAASLGIISVSPVLAENIVGSVKAWQYMQADGWKSADGTDNDTLHNALYQADVIDNYPWTKQFLLRARGGGDYYLADKKTHTVRRLDVKPASGYYADLTSVYQGEDQGKGCSFAIIDSQYRLRDEAERDAVVAEDPGKAIELAWQQFSPKVVMIIPDNCANKHQQAALAAKSSENDRKLQQWVAQQSLAELCRRTGNC
ncbi:hypothetical protein [Enterobacter hormaechei]|uniref:hypothetical protein n=1 Tax=Enterobacter hormaechei TaxID=158836 RepID=UPI000F89BDDF|nr:hypothetical protein [Enterobacter hormaechei]RTO98231.1 hypothetical protein EKN57_19535 [Enterobacter hormaechei]HCU0188489.1 hypothetical protein [Citrobacter koseri]